MTKPLQSAAADLPAGVGKAHPTAGSEYETRPSDASTAAPPPDTDPPRSAEFGGPSGPEPTRFGDWEKNGRCIDF